MPNYGDPAESQTVSTDTLGIEELECTICRSQDVVPFRWGTYHLNLRPPLGVVRCRHCGMLFLSPRLDATARYAIFRGDVPPAAQVYSQKTANYTVVTDGRASEFQKRISRLRQLTTVASPCLLDIGASSGALIALARQENWRAYGIEPSSDGVRAARRGHLAVLQAVAECLPFADASFDIVHAHHVFEHLADPLVTACEAYRVLAPGGMVFIS